MSLDPSPPSTRIHVVKASGAIALFTGSVEPDVGALPFPATVIMSITCSDAEVGVSVIVDALKPHDFGGGWYAISPAQEKMLCGMPTLFVDPPP